MPEDFDWENETGFEGTVSRVGQYVYGDCSCGESETLVYDTDDDTGLVCSSCYRRWRKSNPIKQRCDKCGSTGNVWRDPIPRKNVYLCVRCHDPEALFQNRWADKVRKSIPLGLRDKVECAARNKGTECRGEVKWYNAYKMQLCNRHAGRTSANPFNN